MLAWLDLAAAKAATEFLEDTDAWGAVTRALAGELELADSGGPYEFEVELRKTASSNMRENLSMMEEFELVADKTVRFTALDMDIGFRRAAYLGYADMAGVTKY